MNIIFATWLQSLTIFSPPKFKAFFVAAIRRFLSTLKTVLSRFGLFLLADIIIFMVFGTVIFKILHLPIQTTTTVDISLSMILVVLLAEVNWFVFSTTTLLFLRKKDNTEPKIYLKQTFFTYFQLLLVFYVLLFVGMTVLISLGIVKFPQLPWVFVATSAILKMLITFFWLDSPATIKDAFLSLEKAINCLVYNLPIFAFFLLVLWGFDAGIRSLFLGTITTINFDSVLLISKTEQLVKACPVQITIFKFLAFRYLIFFVKYLWTSMVFVFYDQKKGFPYSNSCLDTLQENEPQQ